RRERDATRRVAHPHQQLVAPRRDLHLLLHRSREVDLEVRAAGAAGGAGGAALGEAGGGVALSVELLGERAQRGLAAHLVGPERRQEERQREGGAHLLELGALARGQHTATELCI